MPNQDQWGAEDTSGTGTLLGDVKLHNTYWIPDASDTGLIACCTNGPPTSFYGNQWGSYYPLVDHRFSQGQLGRWRLHRRLSRSWRWHNLALLHQQHIFTQRAEGRDWSIYQRGGAGNTWDISSIKFPADNSFIKFVNGTGTMTGDYHLNVISPYSAANSLSMQLSTDGTDLGADIDLVNMATSGALAGTPPWNASVQISLGSGHVVFHYNAPTPEVYTATIYTAATPVIPRIPANQAATKADSDASAVSDGPSRAVPLATSAATHYSYRIANPSGSVVMVGDFWTKAAGSGSTDWYLGYSSATAVKYCTDRALTAVCTTLSAAVQPKITVPSNTPIYCAPVSNTDAVSLLIIP